MLGSALRKPARTVKWGQQIASTLVTTSPIPSRHGHSVTEAPSQRQSRPSRLRVELACRSNSCYSGPRTSPVGVSQVSPARCHEPGARASPRVLAVPLLFVKLRVVLRLRSDGGEGGGHRRLEL